MAKLKLRSPEDAVPPKSTVMLYGPPGSGKSTFASTWPGPYYLVPSIAASELKALSGMGFENNVVVFDNIKEMLDQSKALVDLIRAKKLTDCHTLIFDNLTSAQLMAEQELLDKSGKDKLEYTEWGLFTKVWKEVMSQFHRLPVNMIWITHSMIKTVTPKMNAGFEYSIGEPTLTGQSKSFMPAHSDLLLYCESFSASNSLPTEYRVWLKPKDVFPARVRENVVNTSELPAYIGGKDKKSKTLIDPHYDILASLLGWPSQREVEGEE